MEKKIAYEICFVQNMCEHLLRLKQVSCKLHSCKLQLWI